MLLELNLLACLAVSTVFGNSTSVTAAPSSEDLQPADVAAIVLGCLLFLLLVGVVVLSILIQKGYICRKTEVTNRVRGIPDITSTPYSIKTQSFLALQGDKKVRKKKAKYEEDDPIIYMYDDVYHPPNSRPLPGNNVKATPYEEHVPRAASTKNKKRNRKSKSHGPMEHQTSQTESGDPDLSGRIFITTNYKTNTLYSDNVSSNR